MSLGEFAFIRERLSPLAGGSAASLGLTDDAALLDPPPPGSQLVLTKDAMVGGVHFLTDDPPRGIAQKLLRVNLSDLAAMGAEPQGYLLAIARPGELDDAWLEAFTDGLAEDQREFGVTLLGGDTTSTGGPLVLSVTALGTVPRGQALRRNGARPGDDIWVSGTLGDAALGLRALRGTSSPPATAAVALIDRYRRPRPRLALGVALRGVASAALDVSDGLLADLEHIAEASEVGATVEASGLPLSPAALAVPDHVEAALAGGDDYELLFTAPPERRPDLDAVSRRLILPLTRIGTVEPAPGVRAIDREGRLIALGRAGWTHF